MDKDGPDPFVFSNLKLSQRRRVWFLAALIILGLASSSSVSFTSLLSRPSITGVQLHIEPQNSREILDECAALYSLPTVPNNFLNRTVSDRYDADLSTPVLITNATIWTGNNGGLEVISGGEIFLDKGLVKYVGDRAPKELVQNNKIHRINVRLSWVTPALVDMHSHIGNAASPQLIGSNDVDSFKALTQPWHVSHRRISSFTHLTSNLRLRSLDGLDTHDLSYPLSISGGVATSLVLPGSADAIGGQAFVIKLRATTERSSLSRVVEPPWSLLNGTKVDPSVPPRWRQIKHATGEEPSRQFHGTRMDTIWALRSAYADARKLKVEQDEYCAKARAHRWTDLPAHIPQDLKWEALVDVLRGKVKVHVHTYETTDFTALVGLSNEFEFPIAAYHHAHEAYLVPDVLKRTYGRTPGVAMFATAARYKREAYRGSEFAAKILLEKGIRVAMKSDHPLLDSRFLLHEAAQAHYFGLEAPAALAAVTSTPAELIGLSHRLGLLRPSYDADVVIWDSHPLSLGATPQQVFIDGIPQLSKPHVLSKPESMQLEPKVPNWDKGAKEALEWDGLPPLAIPKEKRKFGQVAFVNVRDVSQKNEAGEIKVLELSEASSLSVVVVQGGTIACAGSESCVSLLASIPKDCVFDLDGGSIVPGLVTYGAQIGLVEIEQEPTTNDGVLLNMAQGDSSDFLADVTVRAVDGLNFGGRDTLLAYRSGVTASIVSPVSSAVLGGLSTAFYTGAALKMDDGVVIQPIASLHASIASKGGILGVSSQIAALRKALKSRGLEGESAEWWRRAAEGMIPLVVDVNKADHIATLLQLKAEIDALPGKNLRLVLTGANEAHFLAKELAAAKVGVILTPSRQFPLYWDGHRILSGPPLTARSSIGVLSDANVTLGLGIVHNSMARNTRLDLAWAALESNGTLTRTDAIALGSSNLERLLGVEHQNDLVAYQGGDVFDLSSRPIATLSPKRGFVDLF